MKKIDKTFTATIIQSKRNDWAYNTYLNWPDSVKTFGTSRAVKVAGTIDGHEFKTAFMPWGDGTQRLPISAKMLHQLGKTDGETVEVFLRERP